MNSLQLVTKIRSKAEDLNVQLASLLSPAHSFTTLDKDLLRKQCQDLYELVLKLKTDQEIEKEKEREVVPVVNFVKEEPVAETPKAPVHIEHEVEVKEEIIQASNFQEVIQWADQMQESLDELVSKVELTDEDLRPEPLTEEKIITETHTETKTIVEIPGFGEINIGKATENKRIQYTVMPDPLPLNETFREKPLTYNERIAQTQVTVTAPIVEKTLEAPIDNIKSAINLNKKIAFVNELFKENVVEYAKAIDRLNNATDSNDAFRIHNELKHQYQWDNTNELVQELERLIRRRFS